MRESAVIRVPKFPGTRDRDFNKIFRITEWPAAKAEDWAVRVMFAANSGAGELPLNLAGIGMEGIAIIGINTFLRGNINPDTMIPLLNDLLECVRYVRDPSKPDIDSKILDNDIEEIATRMWLRGEVLTLHLNFSVSAALSALYTKIMAKPSADLSSRPTSDQESPLS